ncbi:MAG: McrC family protein [Anaerolineae bacterium]|nr:McrC family protein [Anaerolineae bacterium]
MPSISIVEQQATRLPREALSEADAELIWARYGKQIELREPTRQTQWQWQLLSDGWVGAFPLHDGLRIHVQPKVPLHSLFGMWDYVYDLNLLIDRRELYACDTVTAFYSRLASALAQRLLSRVRKGLARAYVPHSERLPYLTGKLNVREQARSPWQSTLPCDYEDHIADIPDNQLIAWVLQLVLRGGECDAAAQALVRKAYHALAGTVSLRPFGPADCVGRRYDRLTADYRPMHALCQFFLEHISPSHQSGEYTGLPFQVDMARLFERFVAAWLRQHLPAHLHVTPQERVEIGAGGALHFKIDLVIRELGGRVRCVLDTKYKAALTPAPNDIQQIVTYAELKGCDTGVLIYPCAISHAPFVLGNKRVVTLPFDLALPIPQAGEAFWPALRGYV